MKAHGPHRLVLVLTLPALLAAILVCGAALPRRAAAAAPGDRLWTKTMTPRLGETVLGPRGSVFVAGGKTLHGHPAMVSKYSSSGRLLWRRYYTGPYARAAGAAYLVRDVRGNIIVGGAVTRPGHKQDFLLVKYSPTGTLRWLRIYDTRSHLFEYLADIAVDGAGNVYAAGTTSDLHAKTDTYLLVKLRAASGAVAWQYRLNWPSHRDNAEAVAVTRTGTAYVTGYSDYPDPVNTGEPLRAAATVKVSAAGKKLWARRELSANGDVYGRDVVLKPGGGCYICGRFASLTTGDDVMLVAYDSAGSAELYTHDFHSHYDDAWAMAIDPSGNLDICGQAGNGATLSCMLVEFSSAGTVSWDEEFAPGVGGVYEDVAVDSTGAVYATGEVDNGPTHSDDLLTCKYGDLGGIVWSNLWSSEGAYWDWGRRVCASTKSVFVSASTEQPDDSLHWMLIRYQP